VAIFTESTCLNWLHESENYGINFANKYTQIQDFKNILDDKKIVSTINSAFPKFKATFTKFIKDNFNEFYYNSDGSYEYNINTPEKVLKLAYLSWILVNINKHKNDQIFGYITWEPESDDYSERHKFFDDRAISVYFEIDNYKVINIDCGFTDDIV
jgi:hypothetical protein